MLSRREEEMKDDFDRQKHEFVLSTQDAIRSCERNYNFADQGDEWVMWLNIQGLNSSVATPFKLRPIHTEDDWIEMLNLRAKIEMAFGESDIEMIKKIVGDTKLKSILLNGQWFLFQHNDTVIGEIGLIPFTFEDKVIGRIQDVDIAPEYQGRGYGNVLLNFIVNFALKNNYSAL